MFTNSVRAWAAVHDSLSDCDDGHRHEQKKVRISSGTAASTVTAGYNILQGFHT